MQIRDTRFRETTTKYGLGPTFTVTSSVELWTPTRELRNLRGCHPCNRLRETTTKSGLGPTFTVTSSVELWTPTRELRNHRRCHPFGFERRQQSRVLDRPLQLLVSVFGCGLKCRVGIVGFGRRQQIRVLERPLLLLVQLSFGLRRENLEIFADAIHASINEQLIQIYDGIFGFRLKCRVEILAFERGRQSRVLDRPLLLLVQLCFGLRRENLEVFADAIHASINEQLIQIYNSVFGCGLKCRVGIVGFGRRQQIRVLDRPLLLLVQLCFGLRRENLEIFADAIHASINEQLIQIYDGIFGFRLKCRVEILAFERGRQSRVLDRPLLLLDQLCFGLRRENLEIFADAIHASINEQLIQIYDGIFGFRLKCRVEILAFERGRQSRVLDRPLLLKCRVEILAFERGRQSRVLDRPFQLLLQMCFGLRRENLEIFVDAIHTSINEQLIQICNSVFGCRLKCRVGILGFERRRQSRVLDRPLQLLVQFCFGLRRENLEIFADAILASINEQLIQIYNSFFDFSLKYRVGIVGLERRQQSTVLDRPLQLKCYIGIVGFERRQQSRVLDRTLHLLVQLSFGLRQESLEIFADAIHASINEQLIQMYDGIFGFRLKCRVGILDFERRRQSRVLDRPLQLLVQLSCGLRQDNLEIFANAIHASINEQLIQIYNSVFGCRLKCRLLVQLSFGLRRGNLEISADAIHASINEQLIQIYDGIFGCRLKCRVGILDFERRRQSRVLDRPLQLLVQLCFGLRRENLEIFADAIHASINKQLIQIYDGIFGFRLKCRVGILGFERRRQSRVLDRPLQLLVQFCFGLRRENFEIFVDAIHTSINEQLIQIYNSVFGCRLKCRVGILGFESRQQSRVSDRPFQLLLQLCFGLQRENLEIFVDAIHTSINEQLIQIYNSVFGCRFKCRVGILGFERRRQSRVLDRPLQLLVQFCFGLRRENLEIFVDAIHASINEQLIQIYNTVFGCRLKCRVGILGFERRRQSRVLDRPLQLLTQMQSRESRLRETTKNSGLGLTFPVTTSVVLWTSTRELRNFRGCHPCKHKCRFGILGLERRQQTTVLDRTLQLLIKMLYLDSRLRETTTMSGLGPTFTVTSSVELWTSTRELRNFRGCHPCKYKRTLLVQLSFGLRRENLEIFADVIHASINEQLIQIYDGIFGFRLKCRVGILGFERRRQSRVLDRTLQLLVQLCCGLRQENLEFIADAIHASINEQLIQIYNSVFGCRLKCRVGTVSFGRRQQIRVLERPFQHKCSVEIVAFERRRQSRVLDRPLKLLVQLCCGLRRGNLEIFVDAFHASINEQLIQIYDGIFGFRLKCRVGIFGFERRQQSRVLDRPLKLLVQLCCGLRRENLEIFVDAFHASINEQLIQIYDGIFGFRLKCRVGIFGFERRQQSRVLDRPSKLLVQLCCGLRRENLEISADAIHASINEQLIQIYDGIFGFRLKCRVGILGFERRRQSRVLERPFQLQLQLCFRLRRENLEIFADAIHASTNE
ncbi:hypothetical protein V1477_007690 [Vespula maculifrons]|uniref:Uncharacterized protein n=1 Tax=Vespula maculifrons TaxID=7453 RepID=A0ABD2CH99_VESMC